MQQRILIRRRFAAVLAVAIFSLALLLTHVRAQESAPERGAGVMVVDSQAEADLLRLVNRERQSRGIAPLQFDARLTEAARIHSRIMASHGDIAHLYPGEADLMERFSVQDLRLDAAGENVALNDSAAGTHDALMHSPRHRENILSPTYNALGIGIIRAGSRIYVTQDFARRYEDVSVERAEQQVGESLNQLRRAHGLTALTLTDTTDLLRDHSCQMAASGRLSSKRPLGLGFFRYFVTASTFQPSQLSNAAIQSALDGRVERYSVGICASAPSHAAGGSLWMSLILY